MQNVRNYRTAPVAHCMAGLIDYSVVTDIVFTALTSILPTHPTARTRSIVLSKLVS